MTVCPGSAAVGDTVVITVRGTCGGNLANTSLVFLNASGYIGSGGGGAGIPIRSTSGGFCDLSHSCDRRRGRSHRRGNQAIPVTPGTTYQFATYPVGMRGHPIHGPIALNAVHVNRGRR